MSCSYERVLFLDIDGVLNSQLFKCDRYNWIPYDACISQEELTRRSAYHSSSERNLYVEERVKIDTDWHKLSWLDPESLILLRDVVDKYDIAIVISSTWRGYYRDGDYGSFEKHNIIRFKRLFEKKIGWVDAPVVGATKQLSGIRGHEIQEWLSRNIVKDFIILDDDSDMTPDQLSWHFYQTNGSTGLTDHFSEWCKDRWN